ncbi:hypothetical protein TNCV_4551861 [Trichonephila clavipes]|nr:hypothetical protein TNCV_4551861 [Trichonephila clavipes]
MTGKDILECIQSSKSIIDTDSDGENASPILKSSEMRNIMKKDDAIHWSPSTVRELGHLVAPTGGEQVADACCKRKNCLPGKPY